MSQAPSRHTENQEMAMACACPSHNFPDLGPSPPSSKGSNLDFPPQVPTDESFRMVHPTIKPDKLNFEEQETPFPQIFTD